MLDGISVRSDVLSTNDKGEEKEPVRKRTAKTLQKLGPALQRILRPEEVVLYAMPARSPLSILEQLTAAWWTAALAACVVVVTNKRILFFPVKRDGSWRESVRAVQWGDLEEIKIAGVLIRQASFKFKNGTKATYTNVRRADARKLAALAAVLIPAASAEQTSAHSVVPLCPDCCEILTRAAIFLPTLWPELQERENHGVAVNHSSGRRLFLHRSSAGRDHTRNC
jgi:hypothetical protein